MSVCGARHPGPDAWEMLRTRVDIVMHLHSTFRPSEFYIRIGLCPTLCEDSWGKCYLLAPADECRPEFR